MDDSRIPGEIDRKSINTERLSKKDSGIHERFFKSEERFNRFFWIASVIFPVIKCFIHIAFWVR